MYGKDLDYNYIPGVGKYDDEYEDYDDDAGIDCPEDYDGFDEDPEDFQDYEGKAHFALVRAEELAMEQQAMEQQAMEETLLDFAPDKDEPMPPNPSAAPVPVASADGDERQRKSNFYIDPDEEEVLACNNAGAIIRKTILRVYH